MKSANVIEVIKTVVARPQTDISLWLHNYLRGQGYTQEPRFDVPYDPDGSPGMYLLEKLSELSKIDANEYLRASQVFADSAVQLLKLLISGQNAISELSSEYVVDLLWILWDLKPTDSKFAVNILTAIKDDPKFDIKERGSSIRSIILTALRHQIELLSEEQQDKALLARIKEELSRR